MSNKYVDFIEKDGVQYDIQDKRVAYTPTITCTRIDGDVYITQEDIDYLYENRPVAININFSLFIEGQSYTINQKAILLNYSAIPGETEKLFYGLLDEDKNLTIISIPHDAQYTIDGWDIDFGDIELDIDNIKNNKQDTLISGTNIKTINNESILGNGNIDIQGIGFEVPEFTPITFEINFPTANIKLSAEDCADIIENEYPLFNIVAEMGDDISISITFIHNFVQKNNETIETLQYIALVDDGENAYELGLNFVADESDNESWCIPLNGDSGGGDEEERTLELLASGTGEDSGIDNIDIDNQSTLRAGRYFIRTSALEDSSSLDSTILEACAEFVVLTDSSVMKEFNVYGNIVSEQGTTDYVSYEIRFDPDEAKIMINLGTYISNNVSYAVYYLPL